VIRPLATAVPVRAQVRQLLGGSAPFSAQGSLGLVPVGRTGLFLGRGGTGRRSDCPSSRRARPPTRAPVSSVSPQRRWLPGLTKERDKDICRQVSLSLCDYGYKSRIGRSRRFPAQATWGRQTYLSTCLPWLLSPFLPRASGSEPSSTPASVPVRLADVRFRRVVAFPAMGIPVDPVARPVPHPAG
jgi:hypothetical protein